MKTLLTLKFLDGETGNTKYTTERDCSRVETYFNLGFLAI